MLVRAFLLGLTGAVLLHGAGRAQPAAAPVSYCIDRASPSAARDRTLAGEIAAATGQTVAMRWFDSGDDDEGMSVKDFQKLLNGGCALLLGYPVDATGPDTPAGTLTTKPYDETGFVLVVPRTSAATSLASLPRGAEVAVTFEAPPNLYFQNHPALSPQVHTQDADSLQAVIDGRATAAMIWQPTLQAWAASHGSAGLHAYKLAGPHARWNIVALYMPANAAAAHRFEAALASLRAASGVEPSAIHTQSSDGFDPRMVIRAAMDAPAPGGLPALYTAAQAAAGARKFADNCAVCHGKQMQGLAGPSLKGPNFANDKANFSVSDVFTIVTQNMPASNPGSLDPGDYVQIMAFLLQQNGYPAGATELTFTDANNSKVPLRYHGN